MFVCKSTNRHNDVVSHNTQYSYSNLCISLWCSIGLVPCPSTWIPLQNIGVQFDSELTLIPHVNKLVQSSFYHLRSISRIKHMLSLPNLEKVIHVFIFSRFWFFSYCLKWLYYIYLVCIIHLFDLFHLFNLLVVFIFIVIIYFVWPIFHSYLCSTSFCFV